jgi:hypothetical protein
LCGKVSEHVTGGRESHGGFCPTRHDNSSTPTAVIPSRLR